jgi:hypothetical protein
MVYDLPIQEEKIKPHQITTLHLITALAFITAGAIILDYNYTIPMWGLALLVAGLTLIYLTLFKNRWTTSRQINPRVRVVELLISLTLASYSLYKEWRFPVMIFGFLSAVLVFALFWERTAWDVLFVHLDKDGVKLPVTSRKRFLLWTEIDQVVFRFGTLSIDCADKSLYQWTVGDTDFNVELFEEFCLTQVEINKEKRLKEEQW